MAGVFPECPPNLKQIQPYLKIAQEHENRDLVMVYWARVYCLQLGIKASKQPDEKMFLMKVMDWLEEFKKSHKDNEAITNDTVAVAHLENYALKLFLYADKQDRESNFGKNVVKAFYTAGMIYDILTTVGPLSVEAQHNSKYAKWKAAYIHNCLKNGETPIAGPMPSEDDELSNFSGPSTPNPVGGPAAPSMGFQPYNPQQPPQGPYQPPQGPYQPPQAHYFEPPQPTNHTFSNDPFLASNIRAPSPPKEPEKQPGGFVPYNPGANSSSYQAYVPPSSEGKCNADVVQKASKYCKYASSALQYDDVKTAIDNLQKALTILTTGQDA
ncbi:unnamed protein product [Diamesa tonsa]